MELSKETLASAKPFLLGTAAGAIALAVIGFGWGGWVTGGTAMTTADKRVEEAVTLALAPICVENFRRQPEAAAQLVSLQKLSSYEQRGFVEKGGWATALGATAANPSVARACADVLGKLKMEELG